MQNSSKICFKFFACVKSTFESFLSLTYAFIKKMVNINCKSCKNLSIVVTTINSNNSYEFNNHENRKI